jgi:hypothetical protein
MAGYPNIDIPVDFEINPAKDSAADATIFWNESMRNAQSKALHSRIIYKWGLGRLPEDGSTPTFEGVLPGQIFGRRYFYGKGEEVSAKELRDVLTCDQLDGIYNSVLEDSEGYKANYEKAKGKGLGSRAKKNAKINRDKWSLLLAQIEQARTYSDNTYEPCVVFEQEQAYINSVLYLNDRLSKLQEPMSNMTIVAIIGGAVALSAILLTRFVK